MAIALVLAGALVALLVVWVASFAHLGFIRFGPLGRDAIVSDRGTLQFRASEETELQPGGAGAPPQVVPAKVRLGPATSRMRFRFSSWRSFTTGRGMMTTALALPTGKTLTYGYSVSIWAMADWLPAAALGLLLLWPVWTLRQQRLRRMIGRCRACGYDLRASIDRCPECGTAIG